MDIPAKPSVGPWKICAHLREPPVDCSCGYQGGIWSGDGENIICEMGPHGDDADMIPRPDAATQRANARLIAASPAMLDALRAAVLPLAWLSERQPEFQKAYDEVDAAITRAVTSHD